jgi:hypothetical protein
VYRNRFSVSGWLSKSKKNSSDINITTNLKDGVGIVGQVEDGVRSPAVKKNSGYMKTENWYAVI